LGTWRLDQGDLDGAEDAARRAIAAEAADPGGRFLAARVALQRGDARNAVATLEPLVAARPGDRYGHFLLGTALRQAGHPAEARDHLRLGQAGAGASLNDPWLAELSAQHAGFQARMKAARSALRSSDPADAVERFETLRAERPDRVDVVTNLGLALRAAGRTDEAIAVLEDAVRRHPDHDTARFQLAAALRQKHDQAKLPAGSEPLRQALGHADRAIALSPTWAPAHAMRAEILVRAGRLDEAISSIGQAQRLEPDEPNWPLRAGTFLITARRWDEASTQLETASRLDLNSVDALVLLATAHANAGRLEQALAELRRAGAIDPDDRRVVAGLDQVTRALEARKVADG
jgi:tetratricopeptide (TPR) repeat protein